MKDNKNNSGKFKEVWNNWKEYLNESIDSAAQETTEENTVAEDTTEDTVDEAMEDVGVLELMDTAHEMLMRMVKSRSTDRASLGRLNSVLKTLSRNIDTREAEADPEGAMDRERGRQMAMRDDEIQVHKKGQNNERQEKQP